MLRSLPLSRTSVLSLATICATIALFATGATFAITSSDSASGSVTAASAAIAVDGAGLAGAIVFAGGAGCPSAMNPGDTCGPATVTVTNQSAADVTLTGPTSSLSVTDSVSPTGCDNTTANWQVTTTPLLSSTLFGLGDSTAFTVSVKLQSGATPGCQGETATVSVTVNSAS